MTLVTTSDKYRYYNYCFPLLSGLEEILELLRSIRGTRKIKIVLDALSILGKVPSIIKTYKKSPTINFDRKDLLLFLVLLLVYFYQETFLNGFFSLGGSSESDEKKESLFVFLVRLSLIVIKLCFEESEKNTNKKRKINSLFRKLGYLFSLLLFISIKKYIPLTSFYKRKIKEGILSSNTLYYFLIVSVFLSYSWLSTYSNEYQSSAEYSKDSQRLFKYELLDFTSLLLYMILSRSKRFNQLIDIIPNLLLESSESNSVEIILQPSNFSTSTGYSSNKPFLSEINGLKLPQQDFRVEDKKELISIPLGDSPRSCKNPQLEQLETSPFVKLNQNNTDLCSSIFKRAQNNSEESISVNEESIKKKSTYSLFEIVIVLVNILLIIMELYKIDFLVLKGPEGKALETLFLSIVLSSTFVYYFFPISMIIKFFSMIIKFFSMIFKFRMGLIRRIITNYYR